MNKEKDDLKDMISILIEKGFTDEQIASAIVAYSEEIPAQAPPAGATELDRVVAVMDKINEKADITDKLRVQSVAGVRKGIEMLGGSDDLLLISKAQVDAAIASAINALPKAPTRKDITATYRTRKWNSNDAGKKVYITVEGNGIKVGFISEGKDTLLITGGAIVDLGVAITAPDWHTKFYWSTKHVSNVGYIEIRKNNSNTIHETFYNIIKFEIEE